MGDAPPGEPASADDDVPMPGGGGGARDDGPSDNGNGPSDDGDGASDGGAEAGDDAPAETPQDGGSAATPLDCQALATSDARVCAARPDRCDVVFDDGAGCDVTCARAGLVCVAAREDAGDCGADLNRAAVPCTSGHGSDFCACARPTGDVDLSDLAAAPAVPDGAPADPCSAEALLRERSGFGRNARGGDPDRRYRVTTLSGGTSGSGSSGSLRRALESDEPWWIVFDVDGTITFDDEIRARSRKTIDGRGAQIVLRGTIAFEEARDIIITDVEAMNDLTDQCGQSGDVFVFNGPGGGDPGDFRARDIWLHHVELHDGGDGLLDLRGATNVTVSWTHFHSHKKGLLMWKDSDNQPVPGMHVTMHHNFFDRLSLRGPQFVYGKLHFANNYQKEWFYYGAGCLGGAQCASEGNVFRANDRCVSCQDPNTCGDREWLPDFSKAFVTDWDTNGSGALRSRGDVLLNGAALTEREPATVFSPASFYALELEPASEALAARVEAEAGPRRLTCRR